MQGSNSHVKQYQYSSLRYCTTLNLHKSDSEECHRFGQWLQSVRSSTEEQEEWPVVVSDCDKPPFIIIITRNLYHHPPTTQQSIKTTTTTTDNARRVQWGIWYWIIATVSFKPNQPRLLVSAFASCLAVVDQSWASSLFWRWSIRVYIIIRCIPSFPSLLFRFSSCPSPQHLHLCISPVSFAYRNSIPQNTLYGIGNYTKDDCSRGQTRATTASEVHWLWCSKQWTGGGSHAKRDRGEDVYLRQSASNQWPVESISLCKFTGC